MMSRRRRRHHHKPSPSSCNPISTNRLHHTGSATEENPPPMMIHCHRDDADTRMRRRPVVHLQPNVIARLMGMDDDAIIVPTPTKPSAAGTVHVQFQPQRRRHTNKFSLHLPYSSYAEYSSPSSRLCLNTPMTTTTRVHGSRWRPRRHSKEEELLQKMRQDLQAWQASKAPALQTSGADSDGGGRSSLVLQAIAQEDLRKQKMARYGFGFGHSKAMQQDEIPLIKNKNGSVAQGEGDPSSEHAAAAEPAPAAMPDDSSVGVVTAPSHYPRGAAAAPAVQQAQAQDLPSHRHTPIVLLKPGTTCSESDTTTTGGVAISGGQKTSVFLGLPKLHRDANMSVLLQEVKNRVQRELTVTAATSTCGGGDLTKTKQAPRELTVTAAPRPLQQVTKEDDRGNKRRLFRSESLSAFRRDRNRNASPETYILKTQTVESSATKKADDEESELVVDPSLSVLRPRPGGVIGVTDGQSFRSECLNLTKHRDDDDATLASSPRLLFRSFSAPEPGFAFSLGRLFSSFKQHQASDEPAADAVRMASKNVVSAGFSSFIRGTVSTLMRRHGFSLRRKLIMFRRKTHWSWSSKTAALGAGEIHPAKMEVPTCAATTPPPSHETFNLFKVAQASLSELPPSPVSPLEVAAGHSSRQFFTDLHFTLPPELSPKCLSEFEAPAAISESSFRTDITAIEAAWSRDKAYITELLIAAGLYDDDGQSSANARVDSMARPMPICDDVFEDVEDMYYYRGDYIGSGGGMYNGGTTAATDHRMLFDLANEALQSLVVGGGASSLRQWVVDSTGVSRGKKLVDDVWHKMQALRNNPQAQEMQTTIEGMVAYEVRRSVWAEVLLYEDVYVVGRKIERAIFDELIQDLFASLEVFT